MKAVNRIDIVVISKRIEESDHCRKDTWISNTVAYQIWKKIQIYRHETAHNKRRDLKPHLGPVRSLTASESTCTSLVTEVGSQTPYKGRGKNWQHSYSLTPHMSCATDLQNSNG